MNTNDIPYVLDGETVARSITIEGSTVTRHHVTAHSTGKVACTWSFDFENVPQEQILELASRAVLIGSRPQFKKCASSSIGDWINKTFPVVDFLSRERTKASPTDRITSAFAGMTDEEKATILEHLESMQ